MSERLTAEELAELEYASAQATPGPWVSTFEDTDWAQHYNIYDADGKAVAILCSRTPEAEAQNATFIALSRNLLPRLLSELRALRAEVSTLGSAHRAALEERDEEQREKAVLKGSVELAAKTLSDMHDQLLEARAEAQRLKNECEREARLAAEYRARLERIAR